MQNVDFRNLHCLSHTGVSKNSGKICEECGMDGSNGNLEHIFLLENGKVRVHSEGLCEYGRIILKWILQNFIRMDFDYLCFVRVLNDVLMNCVMSCKFHKILGNVLIS